MTIKEKEQKTQHNVKIKRIHFWRLFWFSRLNNKIHEKDPIFKKANNSFFSRLKFLLDFSWKILFQYKYILLENNAVAGALALDKKKHSIFIYAVGLLPQFRRKGYGTYLMNFTEEFAKQHKRNFVNFSVLLENTPAVSMYKKIGYQPLGLGLTLIRFFNNKLTKYNEPTSSDNLDKISFKQLVTVKEIDAKAKHWWGEEIEALAGSYSREISYKDDLLVFDFKKEWKIFEVFTNTEESGLIAILPSEVFLTLVIFSHPEKTWTLEWTELLLCTILKEQLIYSSITRNSQSTGLFSIETPPLIQIFLTYQHLEPLAAKNNSHFVHDPMEDRQIFFKIIN